MTCSPKAGTETTARRKKCFYWPVGESIANRVRNSPVWRCFASLAAQGTWRNSRILVTFFEWKFWNPSQEKPFRAPLCLSGKFTFLVPLQNMYVSLIQNWDMNKTTQSKNHRGKDSSPWVKTRTIISESTFHEGVFHGTLPAGFLIRALLRCLIPWHKRRLYERLLQSSWTIRDDLALILPLLSSSHCIHWPLSLHGKRSLPLFG